MAVGANVAKLFAAVSNGSSAFRSSAPNFSCGEMAAAWGTQGQQRRRGRPHLLRPDEGGIALDKPRLSMLAFKISVKGRKEASSKQGKSAPFRRRGGSPMSLFLSLSLSFTLSLELGRVQTQVLVSELLRPFLLNRLTMGLRPTWSRVQAPERLALLFGHWKWQGRLPFPARRLQRNYPYRRLPKRCSPVG